MTLRPATAALILFFAAIVAFFCLFAPRFATASNAENLMSGFSFVAILAMGQAFPILVRGIDLSIGAIVGVVGMIVFDMTQILHVPGYLILPSAIAVGTLAGALNGVLIVFLRLQPFIATLATLAAYRGFIYAISGRQLVPGLTTTPITDRWILGLESYFDIGGQLGLSKFAPIAWFPLSFFIMLALFALFQIVLLTTRFGRDLYAVEATSRPRALPASTPAARSSLLIRLLASPPRSRRSSWSRASRPRPRLWARAWSSPRSRQP